ncbi:MAG: hypothetical protein ACD_45C00617G0001 [uncultured bacterium]|nr:MAG: hypothetical protein ACD_45C00617G0001 [uncultured bacterium]
MKFFSKIETATEVNLKKRLQELDDAAFEQAFTNSQLSGYILQINLDFESDDFGNLSDDARKAAKILGIGVQNELREKWRLGDEAYSKIESEKRKIEELLGLKNNDNENLQPANLRTSTSSYSK